MKCTRLIPVAVFLFTAIQANAQLNKFNLSDYKLPDLNYKSLTTNFGFSGSNNTFNLPEGSSTADKISYSTFSGSFSTSYNHYLNNEKHQLEEFAGLAFSPSSYSNKEDGKLMYRSNLLNPEMSYLVINRMYRGGKFLEADLDLNYRFLRNKIKGTILLLPDEIVEEDKYFSHTFSIGIPLKIGTGRIEEVQDARQAVYIFDELAKIGRMDSERSREDVLEFAGFISELKNKRFFDSRLRRMAETEALDSFLVAHNYLLKSDARYFSTLLDFWEYGSTNIRYSGNRLALAFYPGYNYYYYNDSGDGLVFDQGKTRMNAVTLTGGIEYRHEKPISLFWQNSIDIYGYFGLSELRQDSEGADKISEHVPGMKLGYSQTISYYPDTRTEMHLAGSLQYINLFGKKDNNLSDIDLNGYGARASVNYSAYYYISPKVRLSLNSAVSYYLQDSDDEVSMNFNNGPGSIFTMDDFNSTINQVSYFIKNQFSGQFIIGLSYSIF